MNNPLSYTDPTGYTRLRKGAGLQIFRIAAAIVITIYSGGATSKMLADGIITVGQAMALTAAAGAASGAVATGTLKGAVKGGIFAAITFGIAHGSGGEGWIKAGDGFNYARTLAHSVVAGVSAEVDGGQFGNGFISAVLSQSLGKGKIFDHNQVGQTAIVTNAILQGTISEMTGGKFANGAMSAAFRVAFNDALKVDGKSLKWIDDDGEIENEWPAVSNTNKLSREDPRASMKEWGGITPEGDYNIDPNNSNYDKWWKIGWGDPEAWGDVRTILAPTSSTNVFGRSQMYIHGGKYPGTIGCIDLNANNNAFHTKLQNYSKPIELNISYESYYDNISNSGFE